MTRFGEFVVTTRVPTRKDRPVWERFYRLDPADESAVQSFIRDHSIVSVSKTEWTGFDRQVSWDLSARATPAEGDLMTPADLRTAHPSFVQYVEFMHNWVTVGPTPKRRKAEDTRQEDEALQANVFVEAINLKLSEVHPRLVLGDGRSLSVEMPGDGQAPYASLGAFYLGFAQDLARGVVARCPYCKNLFSLTPKQIAKLKEPGRRAYCSDACRVAFIESSEERRAQKVAAARKSRRKRQRDRRRGVR